jgi:transcriptional regulator GlxA family with amidase domain
MSKSPPLHVSLVAVPGTLAMPIAGLYEVLTAFPVVAHFHASVPATPPFAVEIVGTAPMTVAAGSGLPITIQRGVGEVAQTDIVIVPTMAVEESWPMGRHPELVAWMQRMNEGGAMLCSACTGLGLLAETGLLDGRPATTHWAFGPALGCVSASCSAGSRVLGVLTPTRGHKRPQAAPQRPQERPQGRKCPCGAAGTEYRQSGAQGRSETR